MNGQKVLFLRNFLAKFNEILQNFVLPVFHDRKMSNIMHCLFLPKIIGTGTSAGPLCLYLTGLWIRIDSIRIWIQHFSSILIRIHKNFESGSNAAPDPDPQRKI
jgi:hypothetical protein